MTKNLLSAGDFLPQKRSLRALQLAARRCQGCHLYKNATQTVFGEGPAQAKLIVVGEIPGNKEDLIGRPFTGPAGILLRQTFSETGTKIEEIYFTNVVKHFKFSILKKRRIHRSPTGVEIRACLPWLRAEIDTIAPKIILCLGAVAAQALISKDFLLTKQRGKWLNFSPNIKIIVTYHPSAVLRARRGDSHERLKSLFKRDIKKVASAIMTL